MVRTSASDGIDGRREGGVFAAFILSLLVTVPLAAWNGLVVRTLWRWFVVPLGVGAIGLWHAAGLCLLMRLMIYDGSSTEEDEKSAMAQTMRVTLRYAVAPAFILGFAAIYHGLES